MFWFFGRKQKFRGWYVNLERRVHHGEDIDVADHELDINVAPDRTWRWKDEESFEQKTGHPAYWSSGEAMTIRAEGSGWPGSPSPDSSPSTVPGATSGRPRTGRPAARRRPYPYRALTMRPAEATGVLTALEQRIRTRLTLRTPQPHSERRAIFVARSHTA
ncbi:DUF402 domain-containing protein [Streptomyces sp. M10(2022)]